MSDGGSEPLPIDAGGCVLLPMSEGGRELPTSVGGGVLPPRDGGASARARGDGRDGVSVEVDDIADGTAAAAAASAAAAVALDVGGYATVDGSGMCPMSTSRSGEDDCADAREERDGVVVLCAGCACGWGDGVEV
jgi:hypothetical protein